jgi:hypothetical protein
MLSGTASQRPRTQSGSYLRYKPLPPPRSAAPESVPHGLTALGQLLSLGHFTALSVATVRKGDRRIMNSKGFRRNWLSPNLGINPATARRVREKLQSEWPGLGRNSNWAPPEYKSTPLPLRQPIRIVGTVVPRPSYSYWYVKSCFVWNHIPLFRHLVTLTIMAEFS